MTSHEMNTPFNLRLIQWEEALCYLARREPHHEHGTQTDVLYVSRGKGEREPGGAPG